ncbi:MAG: septation protein A [Rhodospirillales bacterium]|nr:septation protein A [Rhodospirillales bacterium]
MSGEPAGAPRSAEANPLVKLLIDVGPLVVFFLTYAKAGIFWATGILMIATVVALIASRLLLGRFALAPAVTAALVVVFGGLTFLLDDPSFIKIKPTIINLLFAGILWFGIFTGRPLLKMFMGEALRLTDEGWRKMTVRWAVFFLVMAGLNEVVWRNFSEATWVNFKVFGILPLTLLFAMAQVGLIKRHEARADA